MLTTPERTLASIVSSLRAALEVYDSPEVARVTAFDTIEFERLRVKPHAIFLHNSIADQAALATLTSVFFEQFFNFILERLPAKHELDIFSILDETSSLKIPVLPIFLANCRKFRCGNLLAIQGKNQLKAFFKDEAENITSNCLTKLYLPGITDVKELREIEALSGKCTYKDEQGREKTKQLITVDEIRQLPSNRTLILSGNHPIIKGRSSFYFRSLLYKNYASLPPIPMVSDIPNEPIPLL